MTTEVEAVEEKVLTPWEVALSFKNGKNYETEATSRRLAKLARAARKRLLLTQKQMAMALDMTGGAVCWWETGRSQPTGGAKVLLELIAAGDRGAINHVNDRLRVRLQEEAESKVEKKAKKKAKKKKAEPAAEVEPVAEEAKVEEAAEAEPAAEKSE